MINYLEKLLDGQKVEWRKLGEVAEIGTGNSNRQDESELGKYPFYVRSKNILRADSYQFDETAIIIPGEGGIGEIFHYVQGKYALHQRAYRICVFNQKLDSKFLFYVMSSSFKRYIVSKSVGATAISIRKPMLEQFLIPIPPLSVQKEIVKILDKMTELEATLEATLEAELTLRRKQYHYYRDKLLSENELAKVGFEWKTLGEAGAFIRGKRFVKADMVEYGEVPCIHYGEMYTYYGVWANQTKSFLTSEVAKDLRFAEKGDIVIVAAGETIEDIGRGTAWLGNERVAIHDACFIFRSEINNKYLAYFFRTEFFHNQIKKYISSGKISAIHAKGLEKVRIPVPSLSHQTKIVTILDKFDTLTQSISEGLPHEIALRRKQYEYYREQLLNF